MKTLAEPISADRMVNWKVAGCTVTRPTTTKTVNITSGVTDYHDLIQTAIDSFDGALGQVEIGKGTFPLSKGLVLPSNVLLVGQGSPNTNLEFNSGNASMNCIKLQGTVGSFVSVTTAPKMGATTVEVSDASNFAVGDWAEIREKNGSWNVVPETWAEHAVGQFVKVTAISGKQISFENPLRIDYDLSLDVEIAVATPIENSGIEGLTISRMNNPSGGSIAGNCNVEMKYAANCWMSGVDSNVSVAAHVLLDRSTNITITGCYIHHAYNYSGNATQGYGVTLINHTGECLIEDNCFRHLRHSMISKQGANGNVLAYNYSFDEYRSETIHDYGGCIQLHGHYSFANLFENNVVQNIWLDHTWGPNGPLNTFFRNRAMNYGIYYTNDKCGDTHNWVANESTHGFPKGWFKIKGSGHLEVANSYLHHHTNTGVQVKSYYYSGTPDFWGTSSVGVGFIGAPNGFDSGWIPAQSRYSQKKYTVVNPV